MEIINEDDVMYCRRCGKLIREDEMRYRKFLDLGDYETSEYFLCVECNMFETIMVSTNVKIKKKKR